MQISSGMRFGMAALSSAFLLANVGRAAGAPREFQDAPGAPQMVVIPVGSFQMGTPAGEVEHEHLSSQFRAPSVPEHLVAIRRSFAMGKFDVTRDEYARFVAETNRPDPVSCYTLDASDIWNATSGANWQSPGFSQTGRDPVVCVSWNDARAYASWLSVKTGHPYRLPTEAEWEYAARAGTTTARYWTEDEGNQCLYANGADQTAKQTYPGLKGADCSDGYAYTSPVGSFRSNSYGLYDMLGNVWQWTQDCWNANYNGAPTDGSAWRSGDCRLHVRRGGSWYAAPPFLRSADRGGFNSSYRFTYLGFRVVRAISESR